jgi:hypothetical protein
MVLLLYYCRAGCLSLLASIHFLSSLSDVRWLLPMFAQLLLFARSDRLPHGILGTAAISSAYSEGGIHLSLIYV